MTSSPVSCVELYRLAAALLLANYLINQVCSMGTFQVLIYSLPSSASAVCSSSSDQPQQQQRGLVYLRVCLGHFQARMTADRCTYGEGFSAPILPRPATASLPVQVDVAISFAWPGSYSLVIEAKCNSTDVIATLEDKTPLRWVTSGQLTPSDQWTNQSSESGVPPPPPPLGYGLRVVCDENLFGADCSTFCKPRDDALGHFRCGANGTKVCIDGWTNADNYCVKAVCQSDCNHGNGSCQSPDRCSCFPGWTGTFCDVCIPAPGCSGDHGSCQLPGECNCETGWGGIYCVEDLEYCTKNRPCQNGGVCLNSGPTGYACDCAPGFAGPTCENVCPPSHCYNGGSCTGTPSGQFQCSCPSGYTGEKCQSQIDSCQSNLCLNGGKCEVTAKVIHCLCAPGFSGRLCDDDVTNANVTNANASDVTAAASPLRHYVVVVCLGVLIPVVVIATAAVIWFVVWRLNRRRRRRTKSSSSSSAAGESPPCGADGDNIRNDLKSLNNYVQRVGYQVPGSLKITNLAAAEEGGGGGGVISGKKVTAHAREVAAPEASSSSCSSSSAAADRKLYGDLNFNPQTSSASPWTGKYEESDKNILSSSSKRDIREEEDQEEEEDIIYSIDKSLDRFSSLSRSIEDNCPSPSQFNRCCAGKTTYLEQPSAAAAAAATPCPSYSCSSLSIYTDPCATPGDDRAVTPSHCLPPSQYSTLV